jgi:hypothetical protein
VKEAGVPGPLIPSAPMAAAALLCLLLVASAPAAAQGEAGEPGELHDLAAGPLSELDSDHLVGGFRLDNRVHFGFHSAHGNSDALGLTFGLDLGRRWNRWETQGDLDAAVTRDLGDGQESLVETLMVENVLRRRLGDRWHGLAELQGERDVGGGVESDLTTNLGFGASWESPARRLILEGGLGYGWKEARGLPTAGSHHLWLQQEWRRRWGSKAELKQQGELELDLVETEDLQLGLSVDLLLKVTHRIGIQTSVWLDYDDRPVAGRETTDLVTATAFSFTFGPESAAGGEPGD